ncbi:hypothetical protein HBI56_214760 [Parastagonospora nodorum]|uniref:Uncharacterized protein n=1 Tax=Phaeosphaeria nodorum (strain SN15 / ATCC MYA-4574 / FGSC 10173) TaxID=321614 RepID=A0A7U2I2I5_PHANO|nr:hypothetical protein HBH56_230720 [Parastagonospora nodorum]QRC99434.1 hypothetical protein JI435_413460 [Parastagonospora nodorum SN15]KAH3924402.1 hypothetical protein HBH54_194440 [Parastagonospora nodorum]KAH3940109.1 hypothetical protein HBH53_222030 [Parastagonospora nodorum]KAH3958366.1 hypothetical protein HBH51_210440 [Parastagonospora nodorum]
MRVPRSRYGRLFRNAAYREGNNGFEKGNLQCQFSSVGDVYRLPHFGPEMLPYVGMMGTVSPHACCLAVTNP